MLVSALNRGIEALKTDHMPALRESIGEATAAWDGLLTLVQANPQHFKKPRTVVMHGIKFGFEKGKGGLDIVDPDKTVTLIRKHLPDQADVLIATREVPAKDALAQLPADQLKKLGVNLKGTGDRVVIRPADGDIDKLVKVLVDASVEQGS